MASLLKQPCGAFHVLKDSERTFSHSDPHPARHPPLPLSHTHTIKLSAGVTFISDPAESPRSLDYVGGSTR